MIKTPHSAIGSPLPGPQSWVQVALVFAFMVVNYADKAVLGLASVPIMRDLGLSNRQFGALGSAFFLLFAASGVAGGFLADRVRCKTLMAAMAIVWACALLPMAAASSFAMLLAGRVLLGAAEGPSFPVAVHALYKWFADARRALPTSVVASGAAFGTGIVAPLLTWIILRYGWHAAFAALGACGLAWAALWMRHGAEGPLDRAVERGAAGVRLPGVQLPGVRLPGLRIPYRQLVCSRTAAGVFVAGFAAYWVIALNITWLANYLVKALRVPPVAAGWIVALPSLMQMLLAPLVAALSVRLARRGYPSRVARGVLGSACVVAGGASLICMALLQIGILKVFLIGLGFSIGSVIFTLGPALIGEITPAAQRGAMLGITNSVHTLAGLCAPFVMGWVVDVGADPERGFREGFLFAGALVMAMGAAAAVLIEPQADRARLRRI